MEGSMFQSRRPRGGGLLPDRCFVVKQLQLGVVQSCDFGSKSSGKEVISQEKQSQNKSPANCLMSGRYLGRSVFSSGNVICGWRPGCLPCFSTLKMFCICFVMQLEPEIEAQV